MLITSSSEASLSEIYFSESIYCRWHSGGFLLARAESSERHYCSVYAWDRSQPAWFCIQNELEEFLTFLFFFFFCCFFASKIFVTVSLKKNQKKKQNNKTAPILTHEVEINSSDYVRNSPNLEMRSFDNTC